MAGKAHRYGLPALCLNCAKPVWSMSTVVLLNVEGVGDNEEKLKAWPFNWLTGFTVYGNLDD